MQIQIAKAKAADGVWSKISPEPQGHTCKQMSDVANALWDAIARKANEIPEAVRPAILRALDSYGFGAHTLSGPIAFFQADHAASARW